MTNVNEEKINEKLRPFMDSRGVLIFKNEDEETHPPGEWGGVDSTQHCFSYLIYAKLRAFELSYTTQSLALTFHHYRQQFYLGSGRLRRYWTGTYKNPNNMSRDDTLAFIVACGMYERPVPIIESTKMMKKRFWFYPNTHNTKGEKKFFLNRDFAFPRHRAVYYRAAIECRSDNKYKSRLKFCDIDLLFDVILYCWTSKGKPETSSDLNQMHMLIQSERICPTFFSRLACRYFVKNRTRSTRRGFYHEKAEDHNLIHNIKAYYRGATYDPPIDLVACPVIEAYLINKYDT